MAHTSTLFQDDEIISGSNELLADRSKEESQNTCHFGELEESGSMGIPNTWAEGEAFTSAEDVFDISAMPILATGYDEEMPLLELQPDNAFPGPYNSPEAGAPIFGAEPNKEEDVKDENAIPGVCGIRNIGNTCFMNSGLQCLLNNRVFLSFVLQNMDTLLVNKDLLTSKFVALLLKIWSGHYSVLNVADFKESMGKYHVQFEDYRQHDCQEFLALLLDTLHDQLNTATKIHLVPCLAGGEKCLPSPSELTFDDKMVEYDPNETRSDLTDFNEDGEAVIEESLDSENVVPETSATQRLKTSVPNLIPSDASSSHSTSPHSTDSLDSWKTSSAPFRFVPIPDNVKPFTDVASPTTPKSTSNLSPDRVEPSSSSSASHSDAAKKQQSSSSTDVLDNIIPIEKLTRYNKLNVGGAATSSKNASSLKRGSSYISDGSPSPSTSSAGIKGERKLEKNELANQLNVCRKNIPSLEDFVKETKTLNTNVLINEEPNNQLKYDSEKFPKKDPQKPEETVDNLKVMTDNNPKSQHVKATNLLKDTATDSQVCKRIKLDDESQEKAADEGAIAEDDSNDSLGSLEMVSKCPELDLTLKEEADSQWAKYKAQNQSIVVSTFQGQLQSTVVCAECNHVSVTYEPFMYLAVPLPHALERQIAVTFVPFGSPSPIKYLVSVNKNDKVQKLREGILKLLGEPTLELVLAEVQDSHITKFADDNIYIRFLHDYSKTMYAFELMPAPEPLQPTADMIPGPSGDTAASSRNSQSARSIRTCVICLEEIPLAELMVHPSCMCVLCYSCIELSCSHFGRENLTCPVCNTVVKPQDEFIPVTSLGLQPITINVISMPVVFRLDNESGITLFGHPALVRLPTCVLASTLYEHVDKYVPYLATYSVLLVNDQGKLCSRCGYIQKCTGCEIARSGEIILHAGESLAVRFTDLPADTIANSSSIQEHKSMELLRPKDYLTIYDCLNAFSESEILDENNPWSCSGCCTRQRAYKSLSLWRCPDTLMVYLKRFMFQDFIGTKVDDKVVFPLEGLDLSNYIAGPQNKDLVYNLQACICHFGGTNSGHYMAYTKHATTGEWYNFNDDVYTKQGPQEEDFCSAYVLFYQKPSITEGPFSQQELLNHIMKKLPSIIPS